MLIAPPRDEAELVERLRRIAGRTLGTLAALDGVAVPGELRRAKGWAGQLLERALGASGSSRAEPDFPRLGIELKTVPVDARGVARESTFVATLDLSQEAAHRWERSTVRSKLARVAFVPLESDPGMPLAERRVGAAILWSPSPDEERVLRADFERIVELVEGGFGEQVSGHLGRWLQLRPKGQKASTLRWGLDEHGAPVRTPPRAFYLRSAMTTALIKRHLKVGPPARRSSR